MLSEDHWLRLGGCPGPNFAEFKAKVHLKMKCQSLSAHHHVAGELGVVTVVIIKQTFLELHTKILLQHSSPINLMRSPVTLLLGLGQGQYSKPGVSSKMFVGSRHFGFFHWHEVRSCLMTDFTDFFFFFGRGEL